MIYIIENFVGFKLELGDSIYVENLTTAVKFGMLEVLSIFTVKLEHDHQY